MGFISLTSRTFSLVALYVACLRLDVMELAKFVAMACSPESTLIIFLVGFLLNTVPSRNRRQIDHSNRSLIRNSSLFKTTYVAPSCSLAVLLILFSY